MQMKLSEAIRLGATMKPQVIGGFRIWLGVGYGTCALGSAADAIGKLESAESNDSIWAFCRTEWPMLNTKVEVPAACNHYSRMSMGYVITHLNDAHQWTRERIADWVELHEGLPTPAESPEMKEDVNEIQTITEGA